MSEAAVSERVCALAGSMRAQGSRVGVGEVLVAHRALAAVDPSSREDAFHALRTALCASQADLAAFGVAFAATFAAREPDVDPLADLGEVARAALPRAGVPDGGGAPAAGRGFASRMSIRAARSAAYSSESSHGSGTSAWAGSPR